MFSNIRRILGNDLKDIENFLEVGKPSARVNAIYNEEVLVEMGLMAPFYELDLLSQKAIYNEWLKYKDQLEYIEREHDKLCKMRENIEHTFSNVFLPDYDLPKETNETLISFFSDKRFSNIWKD